MADIQTIIRFTQQVAAEFPDMEPGEQARLGAKRAEEFEAQHDGRTSADGTKIGKKSIRDIIEPAFLDGGFSITIDREQFLQEHGIVLTYQNLRSALRAYFDENHRVVIRVNDIHMTATREAKYDAPTGNEAAVEWALHAERLRICLAIDELFKDSIRDRAFIMALKMIVNGGPK